MSPKQFTSEQFEIRNELDLKEWVNAHLNLFQSGSLFLLRGGLGAGKTTLVSYVVEALGGQRSQVSSPTFSLHHIYALDHCQIDHMDLYRLASDYDLTSSGFFDVLQNTDHLSFIEWAERVDDEIYKDMRKQVYWLQLEVQPNKGIRILSLRPLD